MTDLAEVAAAVRTTTPQKHALQTPSQTIGPFYGYALPYVGGPELVPGYHPRAIRFHGTVTDGAGEPILDALLEIWQADESGVLSRSRGSIDRDGFTFTGFGRCATTIAGNYTFTTLKPGAAGAAAPYILVTVFARGVTHHLFTRAYFAEDSALHATDAVLSSLPADRRNTLICVSEGIVGGAESYRFDIRVQGENETVFLDFDD
jgi:protocatechuate 3,4-dioxygenase alpha subunit